MGFARRLGQRILVLVVIVHLITGLKVKVVEEIALNLPMPLHFGYLVWVVLNLMVLLAPHLRLRLLHHLVPLLNLNLNLMIHLLRFRWKSLNLVLNLLLVPVLVHHQSLVLLLMLLRFQSLVTRLMILLVLDLTHLLENRLRLVLVILLVLVLTDGDMMTYLEVIGFRPLPVLTNAVGWTKIFHILPHLPAKCHH